MERQVIGSSMTRRDILKLFGAGAATLAVGTTYGAEKAKKADDLRAKAKKNLKLGVFTSVYAGLPLADAAKRIKDDGFCNVVCDFHFADTHFDPLKPDWDVLKKITSTLEKNDIRISGLFGYYNVIDPVPERLQQGQARMDLFIKNWKRFGTPIISTETGTFNKDSQFASAPENYTEKGYQDCRAAFEKLARAAEKTGAIVAIEAYWHNIIDSIERNERIFRDINSPSFKLTMDPCNYFRGDDLDKMKPMLEDLFKRVGRDTVLSHAKDVKKSANGTDLPAAGQGVLDYPTYLRLLAGLDKELDLVIEHLTLDDVPRAREFVKAQFDKI